LAALWLAIKTLLTFKVKAYDENNKICEGTHIRAIIDVEKFKAKALGKK
jgi:predicted thioesterase